MSELSIPIHILKLEYKEFCVKYFTIKQIDSIFTNASFPSLECPAQSFTTRREIVEAHYNNVDWEEEKTVEKIIKAIECGLHLIQLVQNSEKLEQLEQLELLCIRNNLQIKDGRVIYIKPIFIENNFIEQFPFGLPFGIPKPNFFIKAENGRQILKFIEQEGVGLITGEVYPDFTFKSLETLYGLDSYTNKVLKDGLVAMNQTDYEKKFFIKYARELRMASENIPVLIPQAWIQWHSQTKKDLRSISSNHSDNLYRVDFVAFWNNKRYVVLVDDISHYAVKINSRWDANEEAYAKRLKEDRKLRKENWEVFRVSNWELRDDEKISEILQDLRDFIGF